LKAMEEVESVLEQENPKTKTGEPAWLKAANARLDEVTKPLADYAMDRVMEEMLRQRGMLAGGSSPTTPPPSGSGGN